MTVENQTPDTPITPSAPENGKPMSFGDLGEALDQGAFDEKEQEITPAPVEDGEDDDDADEEEGEEESSDEDEDDDEDDDEDEDEEENEEDGKQSEEEEKEEDKQTYKFKVDGKMREFTHEQLSSIVASGAHNIEYRKKADEYVQEQNKKFAEREAQLALANTKLTPAWEELKKKNIEGGLLALADEAGMSKLEVKRLLRDQMVPVVAARLGISMDWVNQRLNDPTHKEKLDFYDTKEENEFIKSESERRKEQSAKTAEVTEAEKQLRDVQINLGVSNQELKYVVDWLLENQLKGREGELTVEVITQTIHTKRAVEKAFEAIGAVRPTLTDDPKFVDRTIAKVKQNPTWTIGQLARWVDKKARSLADKKTDVSALKKDISRKVLKSNPKSNFETSGAQKKPMRFSDLEDEDGLM